MSYPRATVLTADINGIYNISGSISNIPDPINLGNVEPLIGSSTIYMQNGELGPIDLDILGRFENQEVGLFCNDNADEFISGTQNGDCGIYYGLTNETVTQGKFCIGKKSGTSAIKISDTDIYIYRTLNFMVSQPSIIQQQEYTYNVEVVGVWGTTLNTLAKIIILGDVVHLWIRGVGATMTVSAGVFGTNPFIPASFVDPLRVPSGLICSGYDGQRFDIGIGMKTCNCGLVSTGLFYKFDIYPLYYSSSSGNNFISTGPGSVAGFNDINVFWIK